MACNSINSTLETFTVILLAVLIVSVILKKEKTRQSRMFLFVLILHFVNTLGDLAAWRFAGQPGAAALVLTTVGNFITYTVGTVAYTGFALLIYFSLTDGRKLPRSGKAVAGLMCAISLFVIALTIWNGWSGVLYTIDETNTFTWGQWSGLPDTLVLIQAILLLVLVIGIGKVRERRRLGTLALYLASPVIAVILQYWYSVLMLLYPAVAISLLLIYINQQRAMEMQLVQQELELANNKLSLMLSQINPHFLYNSLGSIYYLCEKDPMAAQKAIGDFSDYLRENFVSLNRTKPVSFDKELKHVQTYLALEKMRFEDKLNVVYNIEASEFAIPSLTVQPLVENAVKHGVGKKDEGGTVTIASKECADHFEISISDDGVGFDPKATPSDDRPHIGIENVRQRLLMSRATMEIHSEKQIGTCVLIHLPKEGKV